MQKNKSETSHDFGHDCDSLKSEPELARVDLDADLSHGRDICPGISERCIFSESKNTALSNPIRRLSSSGSKHSVIVRWLILLGRSLVHRTKRWPE